MEDRPDPVRGYDPPRLMPFWDPVIFSTAVPSFLHGLFLSWMCMLFGLLWWIHTRRDLVCQPPRHNWSAQNAPRGPECTHRPNAAGGSSHTSDVS